MRVAIHTLAAHVSGTCVHACLCTCLSTYSLHSGHDCTRFDTHVYAQRLGCQAIAVCRALTGVGSLVDKLARLCQD